jgi:hypothetical protein
MAGSPGIFPMGVFSSPPPEELAQVDSVQIEKSKASDAARWITHRLNEAAEVYKKIPVP